MLEFLLHVRDELLQAQDLPQAFLVAPDHFPFELYCEYRDFLNCRHNQVHIYANNWTLL